MKRYWLIGLIFALGLLPSHISLAADSGGWQPVTGLSGVSVTALALSPNYSTDHTAFAGLRGRGIYRSTDSGATWQSAGLTDQVIIALAISPAYATDHTLYAAVGLPTTGYMIYRSLDGGATWQMPFVTPYAYGFNTLVSLSISPDYAHDHTLYAIGATETYKTDNGGLVFTKSGGWFGTHQVTHLAFSPAYASDHTLFASVRHDNVYRSTNGGGQFTPIGLGDVSALAVSPNYAVDQIVAAITSVDGQLHWSTNRGDTWTLSTLSIGVGGEHSLLFSPSFAVDQIVLAASSNDPGAYRSSTGGSTWTPVGWYDPYQAYKGGFVGGGVQALAIASTTAAEPFAFAGTRAGLYRSPNSGENWYQAMTGLPRVTVRSFAVSPADPARWLVGTSYFDHIRFDGSTGEWDGNVQLSTDAGQTWRDVTGQLDRVRQVAFSPNAAHDHTALACTGVVGQHGYIGGNIYRSSDDGQSWTATLSTTLCHALAFSPNAAVDHTVWAASSYGPLGMGVLRSVDDGATWSMWAANMPLERIVPSPNYAIDHTVFATSSDGHLQKSIDGGLTWTPILLNTITAFAVSPAYGASQTIYAAVKDNILNSTGLYRSADSGTTWYSVTTGLPGNPNIASIHFAADGSALLGVTYGDGTTGAAVYRSINDGATWSLLSSGLEAYQLFEINSLANTFDSASRGGLSFLAATNGGLWQLDRDQRDPTEPGAWSSSGPRGGAAQVLGVSPDFANDGLVFSGEVNVIRTSEYGPGMVQSADWGQTWRSVGVSAAESTSSGAVHGYTFSPNFAVDHTVFASTSGGLLKSTDGGETWHVVSSVNVGMPGSIVALTLSPDYLTSGHLVATGLYGLTRVSDDFGQTWSSPPFSNAGSIAYSPDFANDGTLFASSYNVYRSSDRGLNWTQVLTAAGTVQVSPNFGADHTAFVWGSAGVSKTLDGGLTWTTIYSAALRVFLSPQYATDQTAYGLSWYGYDPNAGNVIYRSPDGGATWITTSVGVSTTTFGGLVFSPQFSIDHILYATGSNGLYRSDDGGLNWLAVPYFNHHAISTLAFSPGWPMHPLILVGTPQGVHRSLDGGVTWARMQGLRTLSAMPLALVNDDALWVAGTSNGLLATTDHGATWSPLGTLASFVNDLAVSPVYSSDHTLFVTTSCAGCAGVNIKRSTDAGETWANLRSLNFNGALAISPQFASDHTVYALGGGQVYQSIDGGDNWNPIGTWPPFASPYRTMALPPNYPDDGTIFAAGPGFWRLPPGETVWQAAASGIVSSTNVVAIAVAPNYSATQTLLAASVEYLPDGRHSMVYRSSDGGANWQPSDVGLPSADWRAIAFSPQSEVDHTVYLISVDRLYRSLDDGHSWTQIGAPPDWPALNDVKVSHTGEVIVSTGAGVWSYTTGFRDVLINGSFNATSGWTLIGDATYSGTVSYDDDRAVLLGPANGANVALDSAIVQTVTIPLSATVAQLNLRLFPISTDISLAGQAPTSGDVQYLTITPLSTPLTSTRLMYMLSQVQAWRRYTFDLRPFAGQTVGVRVGVINDGQHGPTVLYVDNAALITLGANGQQVYLPVILKN